MAKFEPDADLIRKLAALLDETGLSEIEYEVDGCRIRVGRGHGVVVEGPGGGATRPVADAAAGSPPAASGDTDQGVPPGTIASPMVGTIYLANEPGAAPLVKVGDQVAEGQTLLIIEAMKVMNPLASPRAGKVTRIFVSDGQPVEFDEPLIAVE